MPINPDAQQIAALSALAASDQDGPLVMLNLNRYHERAAYVGEPPCGSSPEVSGREAYERYGLTALKVLNRVGGTILWHTQATMTVIGEDSDQYDEVIAVSYPSAKAFLELALDPTLGEVLAHREAGLERAAIIRCDVGYLNAPTGS
ncbi:MAG: DUF1330 domain-containing protein [Solirubrobacterales bacterium]|nr:DUF1330 domain-containing protein [Solirubrobacterales bacterium]